MEYLLNLSAFFLPLVIFSFWGIVGYAILNLLRTQRNILQNILISPAIGFALTILLIFWLNRSGIPVRDFGLALTISLLLISIIIIYWRQPKFPFKFYFPFITLFFLALLLTGRPLLLFGFDWVSYSNDDMANYCLAATRFLNHGYFDLPEMNDLLQGKNYFYYYWFFHVPGMVRSGSDLTLAWISAITHRIPLQIFMPVMLAFHLTLVSATGAMVCMGKHKKIIAFLACLLISFSSLTALGTLYQLIAQVAGLCLLAASTVVLLQPFSLYETKKKHYSIFQGILIAIVGAAFAIVYPELTPFLGVAFILYVFMNYIKEWQSKRLKFNKSFVYSLAFAFLLILLFLNIHFFAYITFLITQLTSNQINKINAYFLIPTGLANFWGLLPMTKHLFEPFTSIAISLGAFLTVFAIFATLKLMWMRIAPIAFVTFVMFIIGIMLFKNEAGFGLFKLAMYIQPFILGVVAIALFEWKNKIAKSIVIILLILPSLVCIEYFVFRSKAITPGSFSEIVYVNKKVNNELKEIVKKIPDDAVLLTDEFNLSLIKIIAMHSSDHRFLYFTSPLIFKGLVTAYSKSANSSSFIKSVMNKSFHFQESEIFSQPLSGLFNKYEFNLYNANPSTIGFFCPNIDFTTHQSHKNIFLLSDSELRSVINRFHHTNITKNNFILDNYDDVKNHLIFIDSSLGRIYYSFVNPFALDDPSSSRSFFNLEKDLYFHGKSIQALGRYLLFFVLNSTNTLRMELVISNTLSADGINKLPQASVIGNARIPFPIMGRGSARVFSPPFSPQMINRLPFVAIDMNREGKLYPYEKKGLMLLYGRDIELDPRYIVTLSRDISLISVEEYKKLNPPQFIKNFPQDLANSNLEYSGVYEDSWISEDSFFVLKQPSVKSALTIKGIIPKIDENFTNSTLTLILDGKKILEQKIEPGQFFIKSLIQAQQIGPRKIELHFNRFQKLPNGDNRPVAARIDFIGFS